MERQSAVLDRPRPRLYFGARCGLLGVALLLPAVLPPAAAASGPAARLEQQPNAEQFAPRDFAWGMTLTTEPGRALQTFVLPQAVLEHCDAERRQLAVFNANGELVPHAVRELGTPNAAELRHVEVPHFPIRGPIDDSAARSGAPPLQIQIRRNADGTLTSVNIETAPTPEPSEPAHAGPAPSGPIAAYILDTSRIEGGIERLHFDLITDESTFVWPLVVSTSSDLDRFTTATRGSLATLRHGGHDVVRRDIDLGGITADYLRLTWTDASAPATLSKVTAELSTGAPKAPLDLRELDSGPSPTTPNERTFDLGAPLPVQALDLVLEKNSVIDAQIFGSTDLTSEFVPLYSGVFYQLEHAGELVHNERVDVSERRLRRIRVQVAPKGGGLGSATLRLQVHSVPEQLLFVARGNGPFQLAFGRAGSTPAAFDAGELTGLIGASPASLPRSTSAAGPLVELGGQAKLVPTKQTEWKKIALWGVLIVAVGLLAALSLKLVRRIDTGP